MKISSYILLLAVLLNFVSCKKEIVIPIDFSTYTATDNSGKIIGNTDTTDWQNDPIWQVKETTLLQFKDNLKFGDSIGGLQTGFIKVTPLFPNPGASVFILGLDPEKACKLKVACVNKEYEILYYRTQLLSGGETWLAFDFRVKSAFAKDNFYRMYYSFSNSNDSVYYKGHGDFKIL